MTLKRSSVNLGAWHWGGVVLTFILGVGLTLSAFVLARTKENERVFSRLRSQCEHHSNLLEREVAVAIEAVRSVGAFFDSSHEVTPQEFETFSRELLTAHSGIQALEWIPRVSDSQREEYVRAAQRAGFPNFQITERVAQGRIQRARRRDEYFPVYFVEPLKGNESALGFDLASNPARLKALNKARDTGKMVASEGIRLVQEPGNQFGFLIFRPVYRRGVPLESVEDRRRNLLGFALGVFRAGDLVESSLADSTPSGINVFLYDLGAGQEPNLLYFHRSRLLKVPFAEAAKQAPSDVNHLVSSTIQVADRQWKMVCEATPIFVAFGKNGLPWGILVGGLLATLLLGLSVFSFFRKNASLEWSNQQLEKDAITRKRMEEALRNSEALYRSLFERAGDAIYLLGTQDEKKGVILVANQAAERMHGYEPGELQGKPIGELELPDARDLIPQRLERILAGEWLNFEVEHLDKQGNLFPLEVSAGLVQLSNESYILALERDISQRKQAETKLIESEERFRVLNEKSPLGICLIDRENRWQYVNPAFTDIFGYTLEDVPAGHDFLRRAYPDPAYRRQVAESWFKDLAKVTKGEALSRTYQVTRKDGSQRYVLFRPVVLADGRQLVIHEDITERKTAEEARQQHEAELAAIYENAPMIMALVDQNRKIHRINRYGQEFAGISEAEIIKGQAEGELDCLGAVLNCLDSPQGKDNCEFGPQCSRCPLRNLVIDTFETGQSHHMEEISLPFLREGERRDLSFIISTTRVRIGKENRVLVSMMDITQRKAAEQALHASEERFRSLALLLPEIIFETDTQGRLTFVNQASFERMGYSPEEFDKGLYALDMLVPQDRDRAVTTIARVLAGEDSGLLEFTAKTKGGETFPCLVHSTPIRKNGKVVGLRGFLVDITQRKKAEEALKASEERFRGMALLLPIIIFETDIQGRLTFVNQTASERMGYDQQDFARGLTALEMLAPQDRDRASRNIKDILTGGKPKLREYMAQAKDGSTFPCLVRSTLMTKGGAPAGLRGFVVDISERKQAEEALRQSEEQFRTAFENAPEGMALIGTDLSLLKVNSRFCEMLGYEEKELLGNSFIEFTHPEDRSASEARWKELRAGEVTVNRAEKRYIHKNGQVVWVMVSNSALSNSQGETQYILSHIYDITERKEAQKEKELLERQLHQAQKLEAVGTLAGGIAHDFNNILTALMGYTELALGSTPSDWESRVYLEKVLSATHRAQKLVMQILTFSRKTESVMESINLNHQVTGTVELIKQAIPKMVNIEVHLAEDLRPISGDPGKIEQILMNLATNANDAMPDGGRLVIETENVRLGPEYCREHLEIEPGDYVRLQVSDTGKGMPPEVVSQIFDPFFTTKEVGKGTGLGLSTSYGIVKSHGGSINCYSEPGQGTTFRIYFPALKKEGVEETPDRKASREIPGGNETILLVDDEEALRDLGRLVLSGKGYEVLTAGSGEEALEIYQQNQDSINLVIMDLSMPGMGGHKCLAEIMKLDSQAKVLMASGYSANGQLKDILAAGAYGYIAKPFERAVMLRKIREVLDKGKL